MARTLVQIKQQIESLEKEAESVRDSEVADVIARIKKAIDFYDLTQSDLFQAKANRAGRPAVVARSVARQPAKKRSVAKFKDPNSERTWTGHGKRPSWYVHAIEGGKRPEDLIV